MNKIGIFFIRISCSIMLIPIGLCLSAKDIYVSPNGSDLNSGTKKEPFKSFSHAWETAQKMFAEAKESDVTVWLEDGIFPIEKPLSLVSSNLDNKQIIFKVKAVKGATPVISGGNELNGWVKNNNGLWEVSVPDSEQAGNIWELFVANQRAIRARFPNNEYLRVEKAGDDRRTNFFFNPNDFPVPKNLSGVELVLMHDWSISRIGIKEIDVAENKLTAIDSIGAKSPDFFNLDNWEPNPRYFLENAPEFIDIDYEWCYLPQEGKILLKLPEGKNPNELNTVIPVSEGLFVFEGNEKSPLKNIHFEGITFRHSKWEIPEKGYGGVQACHFDPRPSSIGWSVVPAAIKATWAENLSFVNCRIENMGGSGIWLGTGCRNNTIKNTVVTYVSGNGIMIGEGRDREVTGEKWWKSAPEQVAFGNTIDNCKVSDCGQQFYGAVGIWCGLTAETTIKNSEIFDLPYTGISIGWMWSPEPTPCRQNIIEGCHIHDIMQILSDGGGIYMLGLQPGSKILNNKIHDVRLNAGRAESNGMFLDEGTTDVVVAGNLIYNIAKSPIRFHKATTNLVEDNFLFCENENPPIRYNRTNEDDIKKVNNKVFSESESNYSENLKKAIKGWKVKY